MKLEAAKIVAAATGDVSVSDKVAALTETITPGGKGGGAARLEAMKEAATFYASTAAEPYLVNQYLPVLFSKLTDKDGSVKKAAQGMIDALLAQISTASFEALIPVLLTQLTEEIKWQSKLASLRIIKNVASDASMSEIVRSHLISLVPPLTECIHDMKEEVAAEAEAAMQAVAAVDTNNDVKPAIPALIKAMVDPAEVPECIHTLASTTFVQTVEPSALALVVPLMLRGFKERAAAIKRQCCRIVANMSKLVEEPVHALTFIDDLIPAIERATTEISDPEARSVAEESLRHLQYLKTKGLETDQQGKPEQCAAKAVEAIKADAAVHQIAYDYIGFSCAQLIRTKDVKPESWAEAIEPLVAGIDAKVAKEATAALLAYGEQCQTLAKLEVEEDETGEILADCKFTLAYGTKVLLHNTEMKIRRGCRYGLVGPNDCGKTTLLRSIANDAVDGFPPSTEVRTVFVEADIQGEISHLNCVDYVLADPGIQKCGITKDEVADMLRSVNFTEEMLNDAITSLSGGWRMKLALSRAMLQKADILLMDEPTNHLDVVNVRWLVDYLISLKDVTSIMCSSHAGLLDAAATHMLQFNSLKLRVHKGNLSSFKEIAPEVETYFTLRASKLRFRFPQPSFLEGVKSRGKALMKVDNVSVQYPSRDKPTITGATVRVSLASRVACLGPNGAGKSTLIKALTGEIEPTVGTVWQHPDVKVGYIAQHAFHHIEKHLDKTPNEYIRWRYEHGEDKEGLAKETLKLTEEEEKAQKEPIIIVTESGPNKKQIVEKLMGGRKDGKREKEYEVKWVGKSNDFNSYVKQSKLEERGWTKMIKVIDTKIAAREGAYARPLTQGAVEQHLKDVGLEPEFGTHHRIRALSGGQKVKVVLAASMWDCPHIIILDEPTNYLDRESLGALSHAIEEYQGGVVMITHNNEFCKDLCPETWVVEAGRVSAKGDADWMAKALAGKTVSTGGEAPTEMVDANGNVTKVKKARKKGLSRKEKKKLMKQRQMRIDNGETITSDSELDELLGL